MAAPTDGILPENSKCETEPLCLNANVANIPENYESPTSVMLEVDDISSDSDSDCSESSDTLDTDPDSDSSASADSDDSPGIGVDPVAHMVIAPTFAPLLAWLGVDSTTNVSDNPPLKSFMVALSDLEGAVNEYKYLLKDYKLLQPRGNRVEEADIEINNRCLNIDQQLASVTQFFHKISTCSTEEEKRDLFGEAAIEVKKCEELTQILNGQLRVRNWMLCHSNDLSINPAANNSKKKNNDGSGPSSSSSQNRQTSRKPAVTEEDINQFLLWLGIDPPSLLTPEVRDLTDFMHSFANLASTVNQHVALQQNYDNLSLKQNHKSGIRHGYQDMTEQLTSLKDTLTKVTECSNKIIKTFMVQESVEWVKQCDETTKDVNKRLRVRISQLRQSIGQPKTTTEFRFKATNSLNLSWEQAVTDLIITDRKLGIFKNTGNVLLAGIVLQNTLACDIREILTLCLPSWSPQSENYATYQQAVELLLAIFPVLVIYQSTTMILINLHRLDVDNHLYQLLSLDSGLQSTANDQGDSSTNNGNGRSPEFEEIQPTISQVPIPQLVQCVVDNVRLQSCISQAKKKTDVAAMTGVSLPQLREHVKAKYSGPSGLKPTTERADAGQESSTVLLDLTKGQTVVKLKKKKKESSFNMQQQPQSPQTSYGSFYDQCDQQHSGSPIDMVMPEYRSPGFVQGSPGGGGGIGDQGYPGSGPQLMCQGGEKAGMSRSLEAMPNEDLQFTLCQVAYCRELFSMFSGESISVSAGDMPAACVGSSQQNLNQFFHHSGSHGDYHHSGSKLVVPTGYLCSLSVPADSSRDHGSGVVEHPCTMLHVYSRAMGYRFPSMTAHACDLYDILSGLVSSTNKRAVLLTTDSGCGWNPKSVHMFYNLGRLWRDLRLNVLVQTTYAAGHSCMNTINQILADSSNIFLSDKLPGENLAPDQQSDLGENEKANKLLQVLDNSLHTLNCQIEKCHQNISVITKAVPCLSNFLPVYNDQYQVDAHLSSGIKELRDNAECKALRSELEFLAKHATNRHHQLEFILCQNPRCEHCPNVPLTAKHLVGLLRKNNSHMPTPTPIPGAADPHCYQPLLHYMSEFDKGQPVTPVDASLPSLHGSSPMICQRECNAILFSYADKSRHEVLFHMQQRESEFRKISRVLKKRASPDSPTPQVCKYRLPSGELCNEEFASYYKLKQHKDVFCHKLGKT